MELHRNCAPSECSTPLQLDLPDEYQVIEDNVAKISSMEHSKLIQLTLDTIPKLMLALMPLLALVLQCFYFRSSFYYIDHLVVMLHTQSFLFVLISLTTLLSIVFNWLPASIAAVAQYILTLLGLWGFVYMPLMLRRVYRQSRFITALKCILVLAVYAALALATIFIALLWNIITV